MRAHALSGVGRFLDLLMPVPAMFSPVLTAREMIDAMILYTCGQKKRLGMPLHPCGWAAKALDDAGYTYELRTLGGYRFVLWTRAARNRDRQVVRDLSGTNEVPVLVLDDGTVISDSRNIVRWAREHPLP